MNIFFKKNFFTILPVIVFSLLAIFHVVFAQTTVSGVCSVRNSFVNAPTFYLPDVGVGYAKKAQPGINTIAELRGVCTKEIYKELLRQYCKQNSQPAQRGVIVYNEAGKVKSTASSAFGSGQFYCNSLDADPSAITGACGLRGNANAPGFFDPDSGVEYIKKAQPGINSITSLRQVCTREVYAELLVDYCKQNSGPASPEVIAYGEGGGPSVGGSAFGSEPMKCPESPTPTKSPIPKVLSTITYPVADLGSCASYEDCKTYCSVSANYSQCATFAQKIGLEIEIPDDKKAVFAAMQKGESPGQCKNEVSCRTYCEDVDRLGECVDFVEKFNLASPDELKEMRQMADVKKAGVSFPGNCKTKESCLKYCDNSANAVVCMEFAQKAGFIPKEDAEAVGKILPYLKSGGKLPGGCTTKKSCDTYCANDINTNECVDFAAGAGFMTKEDADIVKKTGGKGPGNCKSREACDSYCKDAEHIDECVDFAVKVGFISKEDAEMAKKYKITSGPGGCKSKAECEAFCVVNQDVCFQFAKDHGMLSEEDLKNIEEQKKFLEELNKAPPEWLACMEKELGSEFFRRFKTGKMTQSEAKSPTLEIAQRKCEKETMGPDIRKETEVCLSKATCAEFNSCFDALPKGQSTKQGTQQSSGQEQQDETGKKAQARALSCFQEKTDTCLSLSCSKFDACMKSLQQGGDKQGGQQQGSGTQDPKVNAKVQACQKEKINACLTKSCGEFQTCINALGGGGGGGGTSDPAVQAKFKSCQPKQKEGSGGQQQSGNQSQIPQGYSSWEAFCRVQPGDSRCAR